MLYILGQLPIFSTLRPSDGCWAHEEPFLQYSAGRLASEVAESAASRAPVESSPSSSLEAHGASRGAFWGLGRLTGASPSARRADRSCSALASLLSRSECIPAACSGSLAFQSQLAASCKWFQASSLKKGPVNRWPEPCMPFRRSDDKPSLECNLRRWAPACSVCESAGRTHF